MTCGYLLQLTTHFRALTEQDSNLTQMITEEATTPFLRTAVGLSTGQIAPDKAVIFLTCVASAEGHTLPNSAPSNKINQDLTHRGVRSNSRWQNHTIWECASPFPKKIECH